VARLFEVSHETVRQIALKTPPALKQVFIHMESAHHRRWCDLALSPLIVGERH
jgi:hypothetical protein